MAVFPSKKFRGSAEANTFGAKYRAMMAKRPFLLFGLPFMSIIVAGSFILTPATAVRYERHDRRVRQLTKDEELGVGKSGRKVNMKDEYYVSQPLFPLHSRLLIWISSFRDWLQRISTSGIRNESRDFQARPTAFYRSLHPYKLRQYSLSHVVCRTSK